MKLWSDSFVTNKTYLMQYTICYRYCAIRCFDLDFSKSILQGYLFNILISSRYHT